MKEKVKCLECRWKGVIDEILTAKNPFDPDENISGCPKCKSIDSMQSVCDEPECWEPSTCGTPTKNGYRRTCGKHRPELNKHVSHQL